MTRTIVLTTIGTTGDVLPYVALGRALAARGHHVRVGVPDLHVERFRAAGLEAARVGPPLAVEAFNAVMDEIHGISEPFDQFERLAERLFLREPRRQLDDHLALSSGADLVVAHWFDHLGQEAAIRSGVPWVTMSYMPEMLRTAEAPPFPFPDLGEWFRAMSWGAVEAKAKPLAALVTRILGELGGDVSRASRRLAIVGALSPVHNFLAASRHLIDPRRDWPENLEVTGAWFTEEPAFTPPHELAEFLARHPRPIVVSFGSMGGTRGDETSELLLEALERIGVPAIVQRGYTALDARPTDRILPVGYVPHDFLFPRARLVVHHAGSGTTAAVTRAGVPSVPVPHLFDQYYWAGMLSRRGVASEPLFRGQLSAEGLSARLATVLESESMATRAAELGARVRAEGGVAQAVEAIERILAH